MKRNNLPKYRGFRYYISRSRRGDVVTCWIGREVETYDSMEEMQREVDNYIKEMAAWKFFRSYSAQ